MVVSHPEPILALAPNKAQVNWHINLLWSVKDPKPALVADRLTIKAYLAAFGSENVHVLYRDWRGIIMAIDKLSVITRMTKKSSAPCGCCSSRNPQRVKRWPAPSAGDWVVANRRLSSGGIGSMPPSAKMSDYPQ
jgi:hypothetical protein